ncbi:hypothetical protein BGZ96_007105 [Linnemannia gamsii]|uniref:Sphingomyelin phosphodiesterase n=1 Tax=Linnemannia gamsii TaxID=64522 RepID=A0ABQ7K380_9FUNG|nr:hypothetical protein BGZ96_007105 [Linnemannia gamsii]
MRFKLSTVILSLAVASSIVAAPAPSPNASELEKRGWLGHKITEWFLEAKKSFNCGACVTGLVTVKNVAWLKKSWALDGLNGLCPLIKMDADVRTCHYIWQPHIPKSKPTNAVIPTPSGTLVDVLHLSDWHVDGHYNTGSEALCNKALCCRKYANSPSNATRAASSWGDYNCDAPPKLATNMLDYVPSVANISFGIMTGDIPPHDAWLETPEKIIPQLKVAFDAMAIVKAKIYPAIGNHEASPVNMFPTPKSGGDIGWLYNTLADDWTRWLTSDAVKSFKNYGSYTLNPAPGLRIVSLNTNFCYTANFYLYGHTNEYDPHGEVQWLIRQLQAAEDIGERVWALVTFLRLRSTASTTGRPSTVKSLPFSLTYGPGGKSAQNAISTAWIDPSVTPYTDLNPAFRVYKVDTKSCNVFDSLTYIADLEKSASWDATGSSPNWHLEYATRNAYPQWAPIAADQPLSSGWWHNVTNVLEANPAAFKHFWSLRSHSANRLPECTQANGCVADIVCDLRASMRSEICSSVVVPIKKRDDDHRHDAATAASADMSLNPTASVITGIQSLSEWRPNAKLWNKKLC